MLSRRIATPLLDGLFLLLCWLLVLVNPAQSEAARPVADYVLFVVWDMGRPTDIDTYVQGPDGKTIWFRTKDVGYMSLDRDDLGGTRDRGPINQEIVSLREPDGSYLVSIHNYREFATGEGQVAFELQARSGKVVWSSSMPIPLEDTEVPVIELEFRDKSFVRSWESKALVRHGAMGGRPMP